jgi:hypothetical protein
MSASEYAYRACAPPSKAPHCYPVFMTTVEITFRYSDPPIEAVVLAVGRVRDVYGIRRMSFDAGARTLRIEYDASRLTAAAVTKLVRETGLVIVEEPLALAAPVPAAASPAA